MQKIDFVLAVPRQDEITPDFLCVDPLLLGIWIWNPCGRQRGDYK